MKRRGIASLVRAGRVLTGIAMLGVLVLGANPSKASAEEEQEHNNAQAPQAEPSYKVAIPLEFHEEMKNEAKDLDLKLPYYTADSASAEEGYFKFVLEDGKLTVEHYRTRHMGFHGRKAEAVTAPIDFYVEFLVNESVVIGGVFAKGRDRFTIEVAKDISNIDIVVKRVSEGYHFGFPGGGEVVNRKIFSDPAIMDAARIMSKEADREASTKIAAVLKGCQSGFMP